MRQPEVNVFYQYLDFEKPILDLEARIDELKREGSVEEKKQAELARLEKRLARLKEEIYRNLTPWQRTLIARHPNRPYFLDLMGLLMSDFLEIHGDRLYGDDQALVAGLALFEGRGVVALGHQKGRNVKENVVRHFGMPQPEGYRKALRAMKLAEKFRKPLFTFIDTSGAYPGIGAEERGQAEAIARSIYEMSRLRTPIVTVVIGEGGSGGALAIGVADRVYMMENSWYSVISPEGCASILWRDDKGKAPEAAEALKLDAQNALALGVIDGIVPEPEGGAHRDARKAAEALKETLTKALLELDTLPADELVARRYEKFRRLGVVTEG
jgi:acetyl-CoA carboxylase carboxyl transferase subunit alpha